MRTIKGIAGLEIEVIKSENRGAIMISKAVLKEFEKILGRANPRNILNPGKIIGERRCTT